MSIGFPDGQRITQWLGAPLVQGTARAIGNVLVEDGPFNLASWASVILSIKPAGGNVTATIRQKINGGPAGLELDETFVVAVGTTLFTSVVLFADTVYLDLTGSAPGVTVDYALYPANTTTNAQVLASANVNFQKNEVLVASEPTLDFVEANQNLWTVTDDPTNTRMKLALLAGLPSTLLRASAVQLQGNNGGGTGALLALAFDLETWDTDNFHDPAVNPSRITIPAGLGGKYAMFGANEWDPNAAGFRTSGFKKNGVGFGLTHIQPGNAGTGTQTANLFELGALAAGDYLEWAVYQNSGGNLNVLGGPMFGVVRIGP